MMPATIPTTYGIVVDALIVSERLSVLGPVPFDLAVPELGSVHGDPAAIPAYPHLPTIHQPLPVDRFVCFRQVVRGECITDVLMGEGHV
jgi:hypothetical protein